MSDIVLGGLGGIQDIPAVLPGGITKLQQVSQWAKNFVAGNVGLINQQLGSKNSSYTVLSESTQTTNVYNHFLELKGSTDKKYYQLKVIKRIYNGVPEISGGRLLREQEPQTIVGGITLQQQVSKSSKDFVALNVGLINQGFGVFNNNYQVLTEATQVFGGYNSYLTIRGSRDKLLYTILVYSPANKGVKQLTFVSRQSNA